MGLVAKVLDWCFGVEKTPCRCKQIDAMHAEMKTDGHPVFDRARILFFRPNGFIDDVPFWDVKPDEKAEEWLATEFFSKAWLAWLRADWWDFYCVMSQAEDVLEVLIREDDDDDGEVTP